MGVCQAVPPSPLSADLFNSSSSPPTTQSGEPSPEKKGVFFRMTSAAAKALERGGSFSSIRALERKNSKSTAKPLERQDSKSAGKPLERQHSKSAAKPLERHDSKSPAGKPLERQDSKSAAKPLERQDSKSASKPLLSHESKTIASVLKSLERQGSKDVRRDTEPRIERQKSDPRTPQIVEETKQEIVFALCTNPYEAKKAGQLTITKGDKLQILDQSGKWWLAKNAEGQEGKVPSNFMEIITDSTDQSKVGIICFLCVWNCF